MKPAPPTRVAGYAPLQDYAAIGDGRTVALVARDGSIDWLCAPDIDSPGVFDALLDAEGGGRFEVCPTEPSTVERRYVPDTNVLEATFHTASGSVRITDAMTVPTGRLAPQRELVRRIEGLTGTVTMRWRLTPRFAFGQRKTELSLRGGTLPVATCGADAVALFGWDFGAAELVDDGFEGSFVVTPASTALCALAFAHQGPLVSPTRADVEARLDATTRLWRNVVSSLGNTGHWHDAVVRSVLALKLLVYAPTGAIAAAATTSLPEEIGGERNWDYRFCWVRDSAFVLGAFLGLEMFAEADAFFWWLMQASQRTHPELRVLYRMDGGEDSGERSLGLPGYRGSTPVRVGNGASGQLQLDVYGDLMQTVWLYAAGGRRIDPDIAKRFAATADLVCERWDAPDAGLWEVRGELAQFTQSKMMCVVALDRAVALAAQGAIPNRHVGRWTATGQAVRAFVDDQCWSQDRQTYLRSAHSDDLDASLLLGVLFGYRPPDDPRMTSTVDAVRRELGHGPFVYRYSGEDGLDGDEGAFLTCSFWLVEALALQGRRDEAVALMDELVALGNDVGIYAEEIDPETGAFLGNLPQALTHLALIGAALALDEQRPRADAAHETTLEETTR
ncbi:MAG TPA: glycoside hydrolase family 15 protein [Acidimicrobiales bacterium]|nr:glycoside hydrolase family 15 protein [Acidimicrobiales bacterium]